MARVRFKGEEPDENGVVQPCVFGGQEFAAGEWVETDNPKLTSGTNTMFDVEKPKKKAAE